MKSLTQLTAILTVAVMFTACSTPADIDLDDQFDDVQTSSSQNIDLPAMLISLLPQSSWVERSRDISTTFSCQEGSAADLEFSIVEKVYKVFTPDNRLFYVVSSGRVNGNSGNEVQDADGNTYRIEISVTSPDYEGFNTNEVFQSMTLAISTNKATQFVVEEWKVEEVGAGFGKASFNEEVGEVNEGTEDVNERTEDVGEGTDDVTEGTEGVEESDSATDQVPVPDHRFCR